MSVDDQIGLGVMLSPPTDGKTALHLAAQREIKAVEGAPRSDGADDHLFFQRDVLQGCCRHADPGVAQRRQIKILHRAQM